MNKLGTALAFLTFKLLVALPLLLGVPYSYAQAPRPEGGGPAADAFLAPESEGTINSVVVNATREGGSGALGYLRGREAVAATLDEVLAAAMERNLRIQAQQQDREIARGFLTESEAAFDPSLNLSGSYLRTETFDRSELITRDRPSNTPFIGPDITNKTPDPPDPSGIQKGANENFGNFVCVTVDGVLVTGSQCSLRPTLSRTTLPELASADTPPLRAWSLNWGAAQLFPWGPALQVEFESTRRIKNFYRLDRFGLDQPLSLDDPIGQGSRFPWTSSFFAAFITPLPYSKSFGPFGSAPNVVELLAGVGERRAGWALGAVSNSVLRDVDNAYWDLVRDIKQLQIRTDQRRVLEALAKREEVLFQSQRITAYDKAQTDADLENIKNAEQIAWTNFIASSNILVDLLDYAPASVIVPVGYSSELSVPVAVDPKTAFDTAMGRRPEIKVSQLDVESSEILLKHRKTQTRPDLNFTARVGLNQTDVALGYDSWEDSFSNVFDTDITTFFVGLSFRIPFGNRELRSALSQARLSRDQAWDLGQQTINSVTQEINTIVAAAYSTQSQIAQSKANLDLAQLAYSKAVGLSEQALVTDFELLRKLNDLLAAKSAYIDTLVSHKKTRAQLLAAEGVLAARQ